MSLGIEVWAVVEERYVPKDTGTEKKSKQDFIANAKEMNALLSGLSESEFIKVMRSKNAKEI